MTIDTNTKIAGNTRKLRARFYSGGEYTRASLTTELATSNSNIRLEATQTGILGNDISLTYIDTGLETTKFDLSVENDQDIVVTLERDCSRAILETTNTDKESNVRFVAANAGAAGNTISIALVRNTAAQAWIASATISGKIVTITTGSAHGYSVGDIVGISGLIGDNADDINGCFQIATVADTTHFTYSLTSSVTATSIGGFGVASVLSISVSGSDITISSPMSSSGHPMLTPKALELGWSRFSSALALASCEKIGDNGNKPIGYISKTYLRKGKSPAVTTTALDIKREIEADTTTKNLVDVFIPEGTTGVGIVSALEKSFLTGGSNLIKLDPDNQLVIVFIYDEWENIIATSDEAYIEAHEEENIELITEVEREAIGTYSCAYTPNQKDRKIYVEFKANIDDIQVLSRQEINLDWAIADISSTGTT